MRWNEVVKHTSCSLRGLELVFQYSHAHTLYLEDGASSSCCYLLIFWRLNIPSGRARYQNLSS